MAEHRAEARDYDVALPDASPRRTRVSLGRCRALRQPTARYDEALPPASAISRRTCEPGSQPVGHQDSAVAGQTVRCNSRAARR